MGRDKKRESNALDVSPKRRVVVLVPVALVLGVETVATAHPSLLFREDMIPALAARSSSSPWREWKTDAITRARNATYPVGAGVREQAQAIRDTTNHAALAFLLDSGNRAFYAQKIAATIDRFADLLPLMDVPNAAWNEDVAPGAAFFVAVLALDVVHPALTPSQREAAEARLQPIADWFSTGRHWPHNGTGARVIWALYKNDRAAIDRAKAAYRNELFGVSGPHGRGYISPSGAYVAGPTYGWGRLGAPAERAAKFGPMDVLTFTGEDNYYADPKTQQFYDWLYHFALTPFRAETVFQDSFLRRTNVAVTARAFSMGRFSAEVAAHAAWAIDGASPPSPLSLIAYVTMVAPLPAPQKPTSKIFPDGGAAFWENNPSDKSLMGALWNLRNSEWHTHKETNAVYVAAYGEHVLANSGYDSATSSNWPVLARQASSSNTVLVGNVNHANGPGGTSDSPMWGNGVTEGFTTSTLDYASGDSGDALLNGHHQRNFLFVHPADGASGYYVCIDEITADVASDSVDVYWHPNSDISTTVTDKTEYSFPMRGPAATPNNSVALTLFLAPPATNVTLDTSKLGTYASVFLGRRLRATYAGNGSGRHAVASLLVPTDASHPKPSFTSLGGTDWRGVRVAQAGVVDRVMTSTAITTMTSDPVQIRAKSVVFRTIGTSVSSYFVRQGTRFDDGQPQRTGFASAVPVTLYVRDTVGKLIASQSGAMTIFRPNIDFVVLDGSPVAALQSDAGFVSIAVAPGIYDLQIGLRPSSGSDAGGGADAGSLRDTDATALDGAPALDADVWMGNVADSAVADAGFDLAARDEEHAAPGSLRGSCSCRTASTVAGATDVVRPFRRRTDRYSCVIAIALLFLARKSLTKIPRAIRHRASKFEDVKS